MSMRSVQWRLGQQSPAAGKKESPEEKEIMIQEETALPIWRRKEKESEERDTETRSEENG